MNAVPSLRSELNERLRTTAVYLAASAVGHLIWEMLQLPLYTIWTTAPFREQAFAVLHCSLGDLLIACASLALAVALARLLGWSRRFCRVAALAMVLGVSYTVFSEWLNVSVRRAWDYSELMPVLSAWGLRIGLSPLLQWIVVPAAAFGAARRFKR